MKKIGITGGIGSGKTTVCKIFASIGVPVYHADDAAKRIMNTDEEVRSEITGIFGNEVFNNEEVDRRAIAARAFQNPNLLHQLNRCIHPAVRRDFEKWCSLMKGDYVLHEAAILFETGAYQNMDEMILITAPVEERIERVMRRDGMSREEVENRMKNQWPDEKKIQLAKHIIDNRDKAAVLPTVLKLHKRFTARA